MKYLECKVILENETMVISNRVFSYSVMGVEKYEISFPENRGCSMPYMQIAATVLGKDVLYQIWEDIPIVRIIGLNEEDNVYTFKDMHYIIKSTKLNAFSDDRDTILEQREVYMFQGGCKYPLDGDIYFFENPANSEAVVLISETPDFISTSLTVVEQNRAIRVDNKGCPIVIGFCKNSDCEKLIRNYFRHANCRTEIVSMSNTWGDCNGRKKICADFIKQEIDTAADIGVDIVQIDDGWQEGDTLFEAKRDEWGYRQYKPYYWVVNKQRFYKGIAEVTEYAREKGIKVGMWFAPYSTNHAEQLEFDKNFLKTAYFEWGIRFFKLDLYLVESHEDQERMLNILNYIYSFGKDVSVQMDVTRHSRLDYLCGREFGTIFVENRFTKTANYFPHRVLRNLWMISKFIPANRFLFELVNPDLNHSSYQEGDPFVPSLYSMDYLFATVMLSNPLFWMELQFLSEQRKNELAPLLEVWKKYRSDFCSADVIAIGEKPSGCSYTGFFVRLEGDYSYVLLFREVTTREETTMECTDLKNSEIEILASNCEAEITVKEGCLKASIRKPRGYVLAKLLFK